MFNGSLLTVCRVRQKQRSVYMLWCGLLAPLSCNVHLSELYLIFMKKTTMLKRVHPHFYSELTNAAA